ncbi:MAG: hypothetical protein ABR502_01465 [Chitinophagaceae bacterium]
MKKILIAIATFLFAACTYSQKLSQVSFQNGANLSYFSFSDNQGVLIRMSVDGKVLEWGMEVMADRGYYYAPKLQPYLGRVEYFGQEWDTTLKGKVKSIGAHAITYFGPQEEVTKRARIKSLGNLQFDYFSQYDGKDLQGKVKMIGHYTLDYYRQYENEAIRGKLKSIGSMPVTYYTPFDDRYNAGKLKNVGPVYYTWYSEFDRAKGALKSNNFRATVGSITFILR